MELTPNEIEKAQNRAQSREDQGGFWKCEVKSASWPTSWRCRVCGWILESGIRAMSGLDKQFGDL